MEIEHFLNCPYCWQTISMILDLSVEKQFYVEDCEVCCHPIVISYTTNEKGEIDTFKAERLDQ
jgi:hypothetical protein